MGSGTSQPKPTRVEAPARAKEIPGEASKRSEPVELGEVSKKQTVRIKRDVGTLRELKQSKLSDDENLLPNHSSKYLVDQKLATKRLDKDNKQESPKVPQSEKDMRKEADAILASQRKIFEQTKPLWTDFDETSDELREHMKALRNSYTSFNKYPYNIKFEYRGKLTTPVISSGSLAVVCDVVVKGLEANSYFTQDAEKGKKVVKEQADLLADCLQTVCSYTDTSPKARKAVVEHQKLLTLLVKKLDEWYQPHVDGTRLDIEDKYVNKSLTALFMVSAEEEKTHIDFLRDIEGFFPVLKKYLNSKKDDNRLTAIATLANVAKEAEAEDIAAEKETVRFLLKQLEQAVTSTKPNRSSSAGWTIVGLGKVVKNLARNDANKRLLVQEGALPLLVDGLKPESQKSDSGMEKKRCLESLWWLSFDAQNREEMMKNETLLDLVVDVYKQGADSNNCFVPAEGFLFQMRGNLRQSDKYRSIANELLEEKTSDSPAASGHVMMSYQTQYRPTVKSVCDFFKENGLKVWMDIYHMAEGEESTLQTMAEAVEGSAVVIMCVSESYKNSPYCRAEAEYAFMKNKHIIPLKLQKAYSPDGWLGIIQGSKFFYDFTKEDKLEEKRTQLLEAVRKAYAAQAGDSVDGKQGESLQSTQTKSSVSPNPTAMTSVEDRVKSWTKDDVKTWLKKFSLKGEKLETLTADEILYLYNLKSEAPEVFHSMVREDLKLDSISSKASFSKALTELPSVASQSNQ